LKTVYTRYTGEWTPNGTEYKVGDFTVNSNEQAYAVCNADHTSGATWDGDLSNWDVLVDVGNAFDDIQEYVAEAQTAASSAATWAEELEGRYENVHDFQFIPNKRWAERRQAINNASGATELDLTNGSVFTLNLSGDVDLTFAGLDDVDSSAVIGVTLKVTHNSFCVNTWPTGTVWPDDTPPSQNTSAISIFSLVSFDGGTTWNGMMGGAGYVA
jgi:hypothetical protein